MRYLGSRTRLRIQKSFLTINKMTIKVFNFSKIFESPIITQTPFWICWRSSVVQTESFDTHFGYWNRNFVFRKMTDRSLSARKKIFRYFVGNQWSERDCFKKTSKHFFRAKRSLLDIFSKKFFVYDKKWEILRWPWKFEPLGQMRSKGHFEREQV